MNLINNPDLLDRLASSYALGTLRGGARRRFETLAREHPTIRAAALIWQGRMASVTELQAQEAPSPAVWKPPFLFGPMRDLQSSGNVRACDGFGGHLSGRPVGLVVNWKK